MNGLVAKCCGFWLGYIVPGSTAHSVYVKLLLTRSARRMQTTYVLGKSDSLQLPKGVYNFVERLLVLKTWKYLIWCLNEWRKTEEGRPSATILLTRKWRRKGQWLRCLTEAHLGWFAMFSGTEPLQVGQEWPWNEMEWGKMMFLVDFPILLFHLSLTVRRK